MSQFVPFGHAPRLPELLVVPVRRPTFPGLTFDLALSSLPPGVRSALQSLTEKRLPYAALFLHRKDQAGKAIGQLDAKAAERMEEEEDSAEMEEIKDVAQVYEVGVLVQFAIAGDRVKGHVHRRLRVRGPVEERSSPLHVHVDYIEDAEQKRTTKDSAVNVNADDAVDDSASASASASTSASRPSPASEAAGAAASPSSSAAPPQSSALHIGQVDKFEFDACMKEIHATMAELGQQSDLQKRSMLTQSRIINATIDNISPSRLADLYASFTNATPRQLQDILETLDPALRLTQTLVLLKKEQEEVRLQMAIMARIQEKMSGQQNKHLLREQKRTIDDMLGHKKGDKDGLKKKYEERLTTRTVPAEVRAVIDEELGKLASVEPEGQEFNVIRNYLDWLTIMPWGVHTPEQYNIAKAERILQTDHYGLEDVKQRVLEIIATGGLLGHIPNTKTLCLVGPPGTGKTSVGQSIARALGRKFYRFSVGGMDDVSEIKGHRRTYVGAMPGKLVQQLKLSQCANPVIMLDEIDKMGRGGWRGDPAAALLEVLDPEQNSAYMDHYLDVPVDLSKVLFVCTANNAEYIPPALADRMDFIHLSGYVAQEKVVIAERYLQPQLRRKNGVSEAEMTLGTDALHHLIRWYAREAGVRNLNKVLDKIYRKVAMKLERAKGRPADAEPLALPIVITPLNLHEYVGKREYSNDRMYEVTPVGVAMGLAWTSYGGSCIFIESTIANQKPLRRAKPADAGRGRRRRAGEEDGERRRDVSIASIDGVEEMPAGSGPLSLFTTGQLGDVMKESSAIAFTVAKRVLSTLSPSSAFFYQHQLHLHVPSGSTPKDGPSAGITMCAALLSLALHAPLKQGVAMTGELTVTGRVMAIGGVKEKALAARQAAVSALILPADNKKDWDDLDDDLKDGLQAHFVDRIDQVVDLVFADWRNANSAKAKERVSVTPVPEVTVDVVQGATS